MFSSNSIKTAVIGTAMLGFTHTSAMGEGPRVDIESGNDVLISELATYIQDKTAGIMTYKEVVKKLSRYDIDDRKGKLSKMEFNNAKSETKGELAKLMFDLKHEQVNEAIALSKIFKDIKKEAKIYADKHGNKVPLWDDQIEFSELDWNEINTVLFIDGDVEDYAEMIGEISPNSAMQLVNGNFKGQGFDNVIKYFEIKTEISERDRVTSENNEITSRFNKITSRFNKINSILSSKK